MSGNRCPRCGGSIRVRGPAGVLGVEPDGVVEPGALDAASGSHATAYCPHSAASSPCARRVGGGWWT